MKKLSLLLALLLCLTIPALAQAEGEEFAFNASIGEITEYIGRGGDVVIPAEIDGTTVHSLKNAGFNGNESITALTLPDDLDCIPGALITNMTGLREIRLPENLRVVDYGNFQGCPNLKHIEFPAGLSYIGSNCIVWLEGLESVTFTGVVPVLESSAFKTLPEDAVVYVPDDQLEAYRAAISEDVRVEGSGQNAILVDFATDESQFAFDADTGTITGYTDWDARMDIPSAIGGVAVRAIGKEAFHWNRYLQYLTIPEGVELIGESAFESGNTLKYVSLPDSVQEIADRAFYGGIRGDRIHWPESLQKIGDDAFFNCYILSDEHLPEGLKYIGDRAFSNIWLKELYIGGGLEHLGSAAFSGSYINYIAWDTYQMVDVAPDAFDGASYLQDIDLPWDSTRENQLAYKALVEPFCPDCTVWINNPVDCEKPADDAATYETYPDGNLYLATYTGDQEALVMYHTYYRQDVGGYVPITGIGDGVFRGNSTLKKFRVTHSDQFTTIGAEAFADSSVEVVDLYYTTETIGEGAFKNCKGITELTLPASLTYIGAGAFDGCDNLQSVTVLCAADVLPENAFRNCAKLQGNPDAVVLSQNATDAEVARVSEELNLPWYTTVLRQGESRLENALAVMPDVPTDENLFEIDPDTGKLIAYNGKEPDVVIPREIGGVQVKSIGYNAFEASRDYTDTEIATNRTQYVHLRSIVIPETVEAIEDSAFSYCQQLESFVCYAPLETTGRAVFDTCRSLKNVVYVNGVGKLDNYLFSNCDSLEMVYTDGRTAEIGESAFNNCGIEEITIDAKRVGYWAINNCPKLSTIRFAKSVQSIEGYAMANLPALKEVVFADETAIRESIVSEVGSEITVKIPEDTSEEMAELAEKICAWSMNPSTVTVVRENADVDLVLSDLSALHGTEEIVQPEPEPEPAAPEAAPISGEGLDYVGAWQMTAIALGDTTYVPEDLGMELSLDLRADGTLTGTISGGSAEGVWSYENGQGMLWLLGDQIAFSAVDDQLLLKAEEDYQMALERLEEGASEPVQTMATEDQTVLGKWIASSVLYSGSSFSAEEFGLSGSLELLEDGTGTLAMLDEESTITWTRENGRYALDDNGSKMEAILENDELSLFLDDEGNMLTFVREGREIAAPTAYDPIEGDGLSYVGAWKIVALTMDDDRYDAEMLGFLGGLTLNADGSAELELDGESRRVGWKYRDGEIALVYLGREMAVTYDGDELQLDMEGTGVIFVRADAASEVVLETATEAPTAEPTEEPAEAPTAEPTEEPTPEPTEAPTPEPTEAPTATIDVNDLDEDLAGSWSLTSVLYGGIPYVPADFEAYAELQLNADGSALFTTENGTENGAWRSLNETVTLEMADQTIELTRMGDALAMTADNGLLSIFTRTEPIEEVHETPAPAAQTEAEAPSELIGLWKIATVVRGGEEAPAEDYGLDVALRLLEDGSGSLMQNGVEQPITWTWNGQEIIVVDASRSYTFAVDGETLTTDSGFGLVMHFVKSQEDFDITGTWYGIYLKTSLLTGNPRTLWGMEITLVLNEDGTGQVDWGGSDSGMRWFRDETTGNYTYGESEGTVAMPLTPLQDGSLMYGSEQSGYVIFNKNPEVIWTPEEESEPENALLDREFICVAVYSGGVALDVNSLGGDYAIVFHADGTADFTLAGVESEGLSWTQTDDALVVDYYSTELQFLVEGDTLTLNYYGAMQMVFEAR